MKETYSKRLQSVNINLAKKPQLHVFHNAVAESAWLVESISNFLAKGMTLEQQAVLFRSAHLAVLLQAELERHAIPYQLLSSHYLPRAAKDILAFFRLILNPRDTFAWISLLRLLGLSEKEVYSLANELALYDGKLQDKSFKAFVAKAVKVYPEQQASLALIAVTLSAAVSAGFSLTEKYQLVCACYQTIVYQDWSKRQRDVASFRSLLTAYDTLDELVLDLSLAAANQALPVKVSGLTLAPIQLAAGLAWDIVYVMGLADGILPSMQALDETALEAEQRLLYVAVTRAKSQLFLSFTHHALDEDASLHRLSRFLSAPQIISKLETVLPGKASTVSLFDKKALIERLVGEQSADQQS